MYRTDGALVLLDIESFYNKRTAVHNGPSRFIVKAECILYTFPEILEVLRRVYAKQIPYRINGISAEGCS